MLAFALKAVLGLRPSAEAEEQGLDDTAHGEAGYHLGEGSGHGGMSSPDVAHLEAAAADSARAEIRTV
ncbi:MAG: hypothetical protein AABZ30_01350 [Myxococcota bacterium]